MKDGNLFLPSLLSLSPSLHTMHSPLLSFMYFCLQAFIQEGHWIGLLVRELSIKQNFPMREEKVN